MKNVLLFWALTVSFCIQIPLKSQIVDPVDITPATIGPGWDFQFVDSLSGFIYGGHKLWNTIDGGASWQSISTPLDTGALMVKGMNEVYIGGWARTARSTDLGQTWTVSNALDTADLGPVYWLQFLDSTTGFAAMEADQNANGRLYKTSDGGQSWSPCNGSFPRVLKIGTMPHSFEPFYFADANRGFGITTSNFQDADLVGTTDGGMTWTTLATGPLAEFDFPSPSVGHWGMAYVTTDAGLTWQSTGNVQPHYAVGWLDENTGLVEIHCQNVTMTTWVAAWSKTVDGGQSLIPLSSPNYPLCYGSVQVIGPGITYVGGREPWNNFTYLAKITDVLLSREDVDSEPVALTAYPVPARGSLTVETDNWGRKSLKLLNTLGQEVFHQEFDENRLEIPTEKITDGVYFLQLQTETGNASQRIVVRH